MHIIQKCEVTMMNADVKKVLLDMLIKLDEICKKNNLKYYIKGFRFVTAETLFI